MRMRRKPWARPALDACSFFINTPKENIGKWHETYEKKQEIWLELGCGKGGFISQLASKNPNKNFMAIDIKDAVLALAMVKIQNQYQSLFRPTSNIKLMAHEIMLIDQILNENDTIERIYINFCNPWYKNTHKSRRLTHPHQLNQYKKFLKDDGEIRFKTDDLPLFEDSIEYFKECGFEITYLTYDLHGSDFKDNIETEHERMFAEEGIKIKFLIAKK